jgi:hypothetical protein
MLPQAAKGSSEFCVVGETKKNFNSIATHAEHQCFLVSTFLGLLYPATYFTLQLNDNSNTIVISKIPNE